MTDLQVVGAGFSGLTMARMAAEAGRTVQITERRGHIGGNAWSYNDETTDIEVHQYGSHIFHNSNRQVQGFFDRFGTLNGYRHLVTASYGGQHYPMPVNLATIRILADQPSLTPEQARAWVKWDSMGDQGTGIRKVAVSSAGRTAYERLIKGYTTKQWGKDPDDLPESVMKRLPVRYTADPHYFTDRWQGVPEDGYATLLLKLVDHKNISVSLHTTAFLGKGVPTYWTGPLDEAFSYRYGRLPWRTVDLELEWPETDDFQGQAVVNYPELTVPYTRIHEFKHYAPDRKTTGTVIAKEFSREAGPGDEPYYPVVEKGHLALDKYVSEARNQPLLLCGGRLGRYRYMDMNMAIGAALTDWERVVSKW